MQDKRKELLCKILGLTEYSKESVEAEIKRRNDELKELDPKLNKRKEEFERLNGNKTIVEQNKIIMDDMYIILFNQFKERYFIGLKVSTSLIDVAKYYDLFKKELNNLLMSASFKSIKTKLETAREIKGNFLMSLGNAEQLIGLERNGVYEHPKPSTFVQTKKGIDGLVQRVEELGKNMREPLIVARANKRVYEDIISLLDREEEMILIELRNGKSLDYSPLNDKMENPRPTTSAHVEESKEVETKPKCRSYSLLYFILIEKKIETSFDLRPEGKIKAIKILTDKLCIDARQFRKEFDSFHKTPVRINIRNKKNYREVIQLLNEYPIINKEAISMAMSELKIFAPIV